MVTTKRQTDKPHGYDKRKQRIDWCIKHAKEIDLVHYPWGLQRTVSGDRVERYKKEFAIYISLQKLRLLSDLTKFTNANIHNLLIDAQTEYRRRKKAGEL